MKLTLAPLLCKEFFSSSLESIQRTNLSTKLKTTVSFFYKALLTFIRSFLIALVIPTIIIALFNSIVFAGNINPEVANIGYWYEDQDIRAVLSNRLSNNAYISPAIPSGSTDLIRDIAKNAVDEARLGKPALLPVNLNNNHWTALAIRAKADGSLVVFYNDSLGGGLSNGAASGQLVAAIKQIAPNAEIIDLAVHQQNDGSSCGAFTAENLIALAGLDQSELTEADAKSLLGAIKDAKAIRLLHLSNLGNLYQKIVTIEEVANSVTAKADLQAITEVIASEMTNLALLTNDRLGSLYLANNISGFSSGDDEDSSYGVWVRGTLGKGKYQSSKNKEKYKNTSTSFAIGADTKIDDATTVGLAVSLNEIKLKPNNLNAASSSNSDIKSIVISGYGSLNVDDALTVNLNLGAGKIFAKTDNNQVLTGKTITKGKGDIFGASLRANYYKELASVIFVPNLGISYDMVKFDPGKQGSIKASKSQITKLSVTTGISVAKIFDIGNLELIPEFSANATFSPFVKSKNIAISNNSGAILDKSPLSVAKHSFALGSSITLAARNLELSLGYEKRMQVRFEGHVGYVKVRVNF